MRWIAYIAIVAMLLLAPVERVDVAKLLPIQAIAVYIEDGAVVLETDMENTGRGTDVTAALENLKRNTPAVVYLDTAEFLLISEAAIPYADLLRNYLKPSVQVCVCDGAGRVKETAKYVEIHGNLTKLRHWNP